jgi:hypothetical protein
MWLRLTKRVSSGRISATSTSETGREPIQEGVVFQPIMFLVVLGRRPFSLLERQPLARDNLEAVSRTIHTSGFFSLAMLTRVYATSEQLTGRVASLTGVLQPGIRVDAHAENLSFASKTVVQAPPARAGRIQQEIQTTAISHLLWLVGGLCAAYGDVGKRHDGSTEVMGSATVESTVAFHWIAVERPGLIWTERRPKPLVRPGLTDFSGFRRIGSWWLWVDSNHRPQHYECCALTS